MKKTKRIDELGDYFKDLEKEKRQHLDKSNYMFMRLDGKRFHNFTRGFMKPYDPFLHYSLQKSLMRVIKRELGNFWDFAYFQSDEASIIISPIMQDGVFLPFNGRYDQLMTTLASGWSVEFYFELLNTFRFTTTSFDNALLFDISKISRSIIDSGSKYKRVGSIEYYSGILEKLMRTRPLFDCRFFESDKEDDVIKYLTWRRIDAIRNMKNMIARCFYSHKSMEGKSSDALIAELEADDKFVYHDIPSAIKRGMLYQNEKSTLKHDFTADDALTLRFKEFILSTDHDIEREESD